MAFTALDVKKLREMTNVGMTTVHTKAYIQRRDAPKMPYILSMASQCSLARTRSLA